MLVSFRQMWCLSEPNINGFFLSSLILQIRFKNTTRPELRTNNHFKEVAKVKFETEDGYSVASSINDRKLRDFIMAEFNLKPSQVIVTYRQVV